MKPKKPPVVTAIVPAYNELPRIDDVLKFLLDSPDVDSVICVDDGSTDGTSAMITDRFPAVKLITLAENTGKGNAMVEGILHATGDVVLFVDADLIGLTHAHIHALLTPLLRGEADVVISARDYWLDNVFFRALSGERAYFKRDLLPLLDAMRPLRFKVEIFLNHAFHQKRVQSILLSGVSNPFKWKKTGLPKAIKSDWNALGDILDHILEQPSPLSFFYKSYIKHFYLPHHAEGKKHAAQKAIITAEMLKKKISVVIPTYNEEDYIGKTLDALNAQTLKPYEIIVVDNNCVDKTVEIARARGARIVHEPAQGMTPARNAGFNAARGDIIARTDADTIVDKHWIENICRHMTAGAEAVTGPILMDAPLLQTNANAVQALLIMLRLVFGYSMWFGPNMAFTKALWEKAKHHITIDDKAVHEDIDLARAVNKYVVIAFMPDVRVTSSTRRMRDNPSSFFVEYQMRMWKMAARYQKAELDKTLAKLKTALQKEVFTDEW